MRNFAELQKVGVGAIFPETRNWCRKTPFDYWCAEKMIKLHPNNGLRL